VAPPVVKAGRSHFSWKPWCTLPPWNTAPLMRFASVKASRAAQ
jgi:hypothetical protein